jgi:hypothetical protein
VSALPKEIDLQSEENRDILAVELFLDSLGELNALHARITRNEGEVVSRLDEVENFLEVRMNQIRKLRDEIREDQKNMRRIEAKLFRATKGLTVIAST